MSRKRVTQRRPRAHYSVDFDMDEDARPVTLDARSLTLPAVAVIAVVVSSVMLTMYLSDERTRLDSRIDTVVTTVERLATSISQLAEGIKIGASDRYTVTHQALWCARAESVNKGFRCPEISLNTSSTIDLRHSLESVQEEMGAVTKKVGTAKRGE